MKFLIIALLISASFVFARVNVDVNIGIPLIPVVIEQPPPPQPEEPDVVFEELPTVTFIMPGVYVVPNYRTEVFCVSGVYWTQHHNHWYKRNGHHWVTSNHPPQALVKLPRGKYKHWKPAPEGMEPLSKHKGKQGNHEKWKD